MDPVAMEYAVMAGLERENQALRDLILDMHRLLQNKDAEIALKFRLLQARERENAQARLRLAGLEAAVANHPFGPAPMAPNVAAAETHNATERTFGRNLLLRLNSAAQASEALQRPAELAHLGCMDITSKAFTPTQAPAYKASPARKSPAPLTFGAEEALASPIVERGASHPVSPAATPVPNKRLAIVDPSSGKQIEIEPSAGNSRVKPTLVDIQALSNSGRPSTLSSEQEQASQATHAAAPLLQLPPVMAGAPPLPGMGLPAGAPPPAAPGFLQPPPPLAPGALPNLPPPGLMHGLPGPPGYLPSPGPLPGLPGYPPHPGTMPNLSPLGSPLGALPPRRL
eukprot:TRINITY_DN20854_c0_g1_i1.p1 TRINITY_DN20854_c0_g1~~TRINITY_DN20854_c0_g1_i1.p1  ORF type:complete len:341 (-),score=64.10 TRINITY_DN20854_c0_g1_i1:124-1146(-)